MKILVIRLSSIGDIVLTSPVVRILNKQLNAEVHFLTKKSFSSWLSYNPYIDVIHHYEDGNEVLLKEKYREGSKLDDTDSAKMTNQNKMKRKMHLLRQV